MRRIVIASFLTTLSVLLVPMAAYAHVVVTPGQANVAEELVFNVSVPNEETVPVTNIKLLIPSGVTDVTPTTKDGWTITTTTNGNGSDLSDSGRISALAPRYQDRRRSSTGKRTRPMPTVLSSIGTKNQLAATTQMEMRDHIQ